MCESRNPSATNPCFCHRSWSEYAVKEWPGLVPRGSTVAVRGRGVRGPPGQGGLPGPPPARCCDGHSGNPNWRMNLGLHPGGNGNPGSENRQPRIRQSSRHWDHSFEIRSGASLPSADKGSLREVKAYHETPTYGEAEFWQKAQQPPHRIPCSANRARGKIVRLFARKFFTPTHLLDRGSYYKSDSPHGLSLCIDRPPRPAAGPD